jgi:hypothetical protein
MVMRVTTEASAMLGSIGYTDADARREADPRRSDTWRSSKGPRPIHKELVFAHVLRHGGS